MTMTLADLAEADFSKSMLTTGARVVDQTRKFVVPPATKIRSGKPIKATQVGAVLRPRSRAASGSVPTMMPWDAKKRAAANATASANARGLRAQQVRQANDAAMEQLGDAGARGRVVRRAKIAGGVTAGGVLVGGGAGGAQAYRRRRREAEVEKSLSSMIAGAKRIGGAAKSGAMSSMNSPASQGKKLVAQAKGGAKAGWGAMSTPQRYGAIAATGVGAGAGVGYGSSQLRKADERKWYNDRRAQTALGAAGLAGGVSGGVDARRAYRSAGRSDALAAYGQDVAGRQARLGEAASRQIPKRKLPWNAKRGNAAAARAASHVRNAQNASALSQRAADLAARSRLKGHAGAALAVGSAGLGAAGLAREYRPELERGAARVGQSGRRVVQRVRSRFDRD